MSPRGVRIVLRLPRYTRPERRADGKIAYVFEPPTWSRNLKDGRRLGEAKLAAIDTNAVDKLYNKLLPVRDEGGNPLPLFRDGSLPDRGGEPLYVERRTTVNHAMKSCRRAHPK